MPSKMFRTITAEMTVGVGSILKLKNNVSEWLKGSRNARMLGILFTRPECSLAKDDIIPSLEYYNISSDKYINIYLPGYSERKQEGYRKVPNTTESDKWFFSDDAFNKMRDEIEQNTIWEYSGQSDLILMNATYNYENDKYDLNFTQVMYLKLDAEIKKENIESVAGIIEGLRRFVKKDISPDPIKSFSKEMTIITTKRSFVDAFFEILEKITRIKIRKTGVFVLDDVTKEQLPGHLIR
jgi:hypothetical protein